jgi:protein CpxP
MKNKLTLLITSVVLATFLITPSIYAEGSAEYEREHISKNNEHHKNEMKGNKHLRHKLKKMARFLELTDEQKQQIKSIMQQEKVSMDANKSSITSFKEQMKVIIQAEVFDESAFINLQQGYQQEFTNIALIKAKSKHSIFQILTDEQRDKMKQFKGRSDDSQRFKLFR